MSESRLKILYLGGGSFYDDQCDALRRCGHDVRQIDPNLPWKENWFLWRWIYETGGVGVNRIACSKMANKIGDEHFDIAWVGGGALLSPSFLEALRRNCKLIINYNPDNPYVSRDRQLWRLFKTTVPNYDLIVVPRRSNIQQAIQAGAKNVRFEFFAADESVLLNIGDSDDRFYRRKQGVVFAGTWMPGRGAFLLKLIESGVPLRIYGQRWRRAPEYEKLRNCVVDAPAWGRAYREAIASAWIALGLLSEGNCDLHTTRSMEIPAIGAVFCAKRTSDHEELYDDKKEAVFWTGPEDCAQICLDLLSDAGRMKSIIRSGRARALENGHFNEKLVTKVLDAAHSL